jgi:hypothetical protein
MRPTQPTESKRFFPSIISQRTLIYAALAQTGYLLLLLSQVGLHHVAGPYWIWPYWIYILIFPQLMTTALIWQAIGIGAISSESAIIVFFFFCAIPASLLYGVILRMIEDLVLWPMTRLKRTIKH